MTVAESPPAVSTKGRWGGVPGPVRVTLLVLLSVGLGGLAVRASSSRSGVGLQSGIVPVPSTVPLVVPTVPPSTAVVVVPTDVPTTVPIPDTTLPPVVEPALWVPIDPSTDQVISVAASSLANTTFACSEWGSLSDASVDGLVGPAVLWIDPGWEGNIGVSSCVSSPTVVVTLAYEASKFRLVAGLNDASTVSLPSTAQLVAVRRGGRRVVLWSGVLRPGRPLKAPFDVRDTLRVEFTVTRAARTSVVVGGLEYLPAGS